MTRLRSEGLSRSELVHRTDAKVIEFANELRAKCDPESEERTKSREWIQ